MWVVKATCKGNMSWNGGVLFFGVRSKDMKAVSGSGLKNQSEIN